MHNKETVILCPLNWGLGHATRVVPIIEKEILNNKKVIIAADGSALSFLKNEFSGIESRRFWGYKVFYWRKPFLFFGLLIQSPFFLINYFYERIKIKKLINEYDATSIISDNRYGVFSKKVKSVLITHQIFIQLPKLLRLFRIPLHFFTQYLINQFAECWIPDYKDEIKNLSGILSHGKKMPDNIKYIGPLSRFTKYAENKNYEFTEYTFPDILILISGPEPFRTRLENEKFNKYKASGKNVVMVCGIPKLKKRDYSCNEIKVFNKNGIEETVTPVLEIDLINSKLKKPGGCIVKISHLSTKDLYAYLTNVRKIESQSGYSTIMDLHCLNLKAELSYTPGQTEQIYLLTRLRTTNNIIDFTKDFFA